MVSPEYSLYAMLRCCEVLYGNNVLIAKPSQADEAQSTHQCVIAAGTDAVARLRWTCMVIGYGTRLDSTCSGPQ